MISKFKFVLLGLGLMAIPANASRSQAEDGLHLFILSGQSNMAGLRPDESFTPAVTTAFGKDKVIVVHDAHGGQPIRRWDKGWAAKRDESKKKQPQPGDLYAKLLSKVKKAIGEKKVASVTFLWMQGERDAREKNADVYAASFSRLIDQIKKDLNRDSINVVIGRLSDFDMKNKRYPHWTKIREVQVKFAADHPNTEWVDTDDLNDGLNRRGKEIKNDLHYSAVGYKTFGSRLAEKAINMLRKKSEKSDAPITPAGSPVFTKNSALVGTIEDVDLNAAKPDKLIEYKVAGDVKLNLHLFQPSDLKDTDKRPAIVFFFGGGWNGGTPSQFYKQSRYLASRGMVAFCAEYRIRSKHGTPPKVCVEDGKSAIRYVRKNAKKFGIDPQRIAAGGGSAGGHVAAATATVSKFDASTDPIDVNPKPNALVLFNPVYDNSKDGYGYERVKDYWSDISPMHNLSKATPPTTVFLGTKDKLIPVSTGKAFQSKMQELGCRSELHLYEGKPHGFFNTGESFVDTVEKMDQFLVSLNYLDGKPNIRQLLPDGPTRKSNSKKPSKKKSRKKKADKIALSA